VPQAVKAVTGLLAAILIARGLGPGRFGEYALVLSVAGLTASLSDLGIGQTAVRYASNAAAHGDAAGHLAVLRWAFRKRMQLVLAISGVAFVAAPVVAERIWHVDRLTPVLRLSLLVGVFEAIAAVPALYFQSCRRFGTHSLVAVGQHLTAFAGILALWVTGRWSVGNVVAVTVVSAALGAMTFLFTVPRGALVASGSPAGRATFDWSGEAGPERTRRDDRSRDAFARYMLLSSLVVLLTLRADVWLMGALLDAAQVGAYAVATRFTVPLTILLGAFSTALWPRIAVATSHDATVALLRRTFKFSCIVAAACVPYAIAAPLVAPDLLGEAYRDSALLGQLLCIRGTLSILICPIGIISYNLGMVGKYWLVNMLQLAVVVSLNLWLLPVVGSAGAAVALIANDAVGFVVLGGLILRRVRAQRWPAAPPPAPDGRERVSSAPGDIDSARVSL